MTDGKKKEPSDEALARFKQNHPLRQPITTSNGAPIGNKNIQTVGPRGPMLMQDVVYMDEMAHFDRERISERVVHAKGGGALAFYHTLQPPTNYYASLQNAKKQRM